MGLGGRVEDFEGDDDLGVPKDPGGRQNLEERFPILGKGGTKPP
jgi:hypothetical protein